MFNVLEWLHLFLQRLASCHFPHTNFSILITNRMVHTYFSLNIFNGNYSYFEVQHIEKEGKEKTPQPWTIYLFLSTLFYVIINFFFLDKHKNLIVDIKLYFPSLLLFSFIFIVYIDDFNMRVNQCGTSKILNLGHYM